MRKISYVIAAAAAMMAISCNKNDSVAPVQSAKGDPCTLTITLKSPANNATKATVADSDAEAKVNSVDIFILDATGARIISSDKSASDYRVNTPSPVDGKEHTYTLAVSTNTAAKKVYALVNLGESDLSGVDTEEALLKKYFELSDQEVGAFQMIGSSSLDLTGASTATVSIDVNRAVARLKINKITRNFTNTTLQNGVLAINNIYVYNGVDQARYDFMEDSQIDWFFHKFAWNAEGYSVWSNKDEFPACEPEYDLASCFINQKVYEGSSIDLSDAIYSVYSMPNTFSVDTTGAVNGEFTARAARLMVTATFDYTDSKGQAQRYYMYYPIALNTVLENNHSYEIDNLNITGLGIIGKPGTVGEEIDTTLKTVDVTFELVVKDWEQVLVTGEGSAEGEFEV